MRIINLPLPIASNEDVIDRLSAALAEGRGKVRLVVLDHITSNTAAVLPIVRMAEICRSNGAVVVVDAAHSLFIQDIEIYPRSMHSDTVLKESAADKQTNLHIADVADVWISNCHKWLCSPKGAAFMWISPRMTSRIRPAILSHGFHLSEGSPDAAGEGFSVPSKVLSGFVWDGCRDYAALLTIPSVLRFWENFPSCDR